MGPNGATTPGLAMVVQWSVIQLPLWCARILFSWRLGREGQPNSTRAPAEVQFGIKHLLGWTTCVAVAIGTGKLIVSREILQESNAIGFGLFLTFNSLYAWPTLLSGLAQHRAVLGGFAAFGFMLVITFAEPMVFSAVHGKGGDGGFFWLLNGVQFAWIAGSVWFLRRLGLRLVRG